MVTVSTLLCPCTVECCTFTATSLPLCNTARCTWAREAEPGQGGGGHEQ